ncbi:uncharacterized protein [Rutidosis leptorrhynchoides]|uniref:uncharacterized protein n=1 Tax=Rutidosis leptorrhynchoides TaxID=125765 RepID=UPI003A99BCC1
MEARVADEVQVQSSPKLKVNEPQVPYPRALEPEKPRKHVCKSNDTNHICVNVPLIDVLAGMPNYGKFLKNLLAKKGEHEKASTAFLEAECNSLIKKCELPPKLGDPVPFIMPCLVDGSDLIRSLADSGASINLIPYSLYLWLNLGDLKPTTTGVRLIDQSVSGPVGIAENLLLELVH